MYPEDEAKNTGGRHSQCDTMPVVVICFFFNNKTWAGTELGNKTHSSLMNDHLSKHDLLNADQDTSS